MRNSKTVLIDKNPGRNSQTFGIARELGTDVDLIHEPSVGVVGNKGDSQCYIGVSSKVEKSNCSVKNLIFGVDASLCVELRIGSGYCNQSETILWKREVRHQTLLTLLSKCNSS